MTTHVAALAVAAALLGPGEGMPPQPATVAEELAKGKQLVSQEKYQDAVAVLVGVVSQLPWTGARDPEAAVAFLYLGLAYAGLGQSSPATTQFLQALRRDPTIAPDPKTTPAATLEIFANAVRDARAVGLIGEPKKKRGHGFLYAAGAGALLAGGAAVVAGSDAPSAADTGSIPTISNLVVGPIQAIDDTVGLVSLEFDFQDPDGDVKYVMVRVNQVSPAITPLPEALGKKEGHVQLSQTISLPPRGLQVTIWVNVRDFRGGLSNSLRAATVWN